MLAKVIARAPTRPQAARRLAAALARARAARRRSPTATCSSRSCATRRSWPARSAPDFLDEVPLRALEGRSLPGTATQQSLLLVAAAVGRAEAGAARRPVQRGVPIGWRNVVSQPAGRHLRRSTAPRSGVGLARRPRRLPVRRRRTVPGRSGSRAPTPRAQPCGSSSSTTASPIAFDGAPRRRPRSTSTSPLGHVALTVVPRFVDPADAGRQRLAAGADAGHGRPASRSRPGSRSRPASRCSCSRR